MKTHRYVALNGLFVAVALLLSVGVAWPTEAVALPHFSVQYDKRCSYCHTAWPQLSARGREFRLMGYRLEDEDAEVDADADARFPISAMLVARPYDKKDSEDDPNMRALHEAELLVASRIAENWSGYFELEAEDEIDDSFGIELQPASLTYHLHPAVNLQAVWGPLFWPDPYGFIGNTFKLTRGYPSVIDQRFGGADARLRDTRQSLNLYGRPVPQLLYILGISGEPEDALGTDPEAYSARLAFDIMDDVMIGAFGVTGETDAAATTDITTTTVAGVPGVLVETTDTTPLREFDRWGADFQADFGAARLQGAFVRATDDDAAATAEVENDVWSIQGYYVFEGDRGPGFVPIVRYDFYERSDGEDEFHELVLNLSYYFVPNVKAFVEYWDQIDVPDGVDGDKRWTLQAMAAF